MLDISSASTAKNRLFEQLPKLRGLPPLAMSCQPAGFEALAKQLIAITRAEPTTADLDRKIVEGCAAELDLARWNAWKSP